MADEAFKAAMNEWIALKAQLSAARKDLGVLNKREKELREYVTTHMATNEIDTVKIRDSVKVNLKSKTKKGGITKDVIIRGLTAYFGGNSTQIEGAFKAIVDAQPKKETQAVSILGLKNINGSS